MRPQKINVAKNQNRLSGTCVFYMCGNRQIFATLNAMYGKTKLYLKRKHDLFLALQKQNNRKGNKSIDIKYIHN